MKKHSLILTLALIFLSVSLFSQVNIGFSAGLNTSKVSSSDIAGFSPNFKSIDGTRIAAIAEFEITEKFSLQPEIAYTSRGFKIKEGIDLKLFGFDLPLGVEAVTKFKYVEVPLLAKYKFGDKAVKAYIVAGPSIGYATKGKIKTQANFILDIPLTSSDINLQSNNIQRFDFSGVIGAGLDFNVGNGSLFVDARYTHGFSKMDNLSIADLAVQNRNFGVSLGYKFQIN
jgi:hypothetical protein